MSLKRSHLTVSRPCEGCGTLIIGRPGRLAKRKFCSRKCAANQPRSQRKSPAFVVCAWCGEEFTRTKPSFAKTQRFCSLSCSSSHNNSKISHLGVLIPSSIEIEVSGWLEEMKISFESQAPISRFSADILLDSVPLVIECDGDYWHSLPGRREFDVMRDKMMRSWGYETLRLREFDIWNNQDECKQRIVQSINQLEVKYAACTK